MPSGPGAESEQDLSVLNKSAKVIGVSIFLLFSSGTWGVFLQNSFLSSVSTLLSPFSYNVL